jgi:hypothetical protein
MSVNLKSMFSWKSITQKTNEILDKILPHEARSEFCQIFRSFFGQWSFKEKCFWDLMTFWTVIGKQFRVFFWKSDDTKISFWDFLTFTDPEEPVEVINEEGEEDLEVTEDDKYEQEPKQISVQIEEQSRRPRQSCNKNLFESKSMTNLKPERLSMKRRHRFSGNNQSIISTLLYMLSYGQSS